MVTTVKILILLAIFQLSLSCTDSKSSKPAPNAEVINRAMATSTTTPPPIDLAFSQGSADLGVGTRYSVSNNIFLNCDPAISVAFLPFKIKIAFGGGGPPPLDCTGCVYKIRCMANTNFTIGFEISHEDKSGLLPSSLTDAFYGGGSLNLACPADGSYEDSLGSVTLARYNRLTLKQGGYSDVEYVKCIQ